jgi:hypothetical protein
MSSALRPLDKPPVIVDQFRPEWRIRKNCLKEKFIRNGSEPKAPQESGITKDKMIYIP